MNKLLFSLFALLIVCLAACNKQAGPGGTSTIKGTVIIDSIYAEKSGVYYATDQRMGGLRVYLSYGDSLINQKDTRTNPDGTFFFDYLNKGTYTVYIIGDNFWTTNNQMTASAKVEITDRKSTVTSSDLHINLKK